MEFSFAAAFVNLVFVAVMITLAYSENRLTMAQMVRRGFWKPFPATRHLAMYSYVFILTPVIGLIVANGTNPTRSLYGIVLAASLIVSYGMHRMWMGTSFTEHILDSTGFTRSGWVHVVYMAFFLSEVANFYWFSPDVPEGAQMLVGILLMIHVPIATIGVGLMKDKHVDAGSVITTLVADGLILASLIW